MCLYNKYNTHDCSSTDSTTIVYMLVIAGIHYQIDSYMGSCQPISALDLGDLFVSQGPNSTIRMMTAMEFFHAKNARVHYVGTVRVVFRNENSHTYSIGFV